MPSVCLYYLLHVVASLTVPSIQERQGGGRPFETTFIPDSSFAGPPKRMTILNSPIFWSCGNVFPTKMCKENLPLKRTLRPNNKQTVDRIIHVEIMLPYTGGAQTTQTSFQRRAGQARGTGHRHTRTTLKSSFTQNNGAKFACYVQ
jgi:hypothetical protein